MEVIMYYKNSSKLTLFALLSLAAIQPTLSAALPGQVSPVTNQSTIEWVFDKISFNIPVNFNSIYKGINSHPWLTMAALSGATYGFVKLCGYAHNKVVAAKTLMMQLNKYHDCKMVWRQTQEDLKTLKENASKNAFILGGEKLQKQVEFYFNNFDETTRDQLIHLILTHLVPFRTYILTIPQLSMA